MAGSVKPSAGHHVYGVLWRPTPRDMAALHAYELLHRCLYDVRHLAVKLDRKCVRAKIYVLRRTVTGKPKPGYVQTVAAAARAWKLPERYVRSVERWSVSRFPGSRIIGAGELA